MNNIKKNRSVQYMNKMFIAILYKYSVITALRWTYYFKMGIKLNLNSPVLFQEKLQWLKVYWQHPLVAICADKLMIREYLKLLDLDNLAVPLLGVYTEPNEIKFDSLPDKFVLKTSNGCGTNFICKNKKNIDQKAIRKILAKWLKIKISHLAVEPHYDRMIPRIICEEYLDDYSGKLPIDYKVFCFNGIAEFVNVILDRESGYKEIIMDKEGKSMDVLKNEASMMNFNKPACFSEMFKIANILAKPFPFVRIDFYIINGKIYVGEMTFTPVGGYSKAFKDEFYIKMGEMISLPEKYSIIK